MLRFLAAVGIVALSLPAQEKPVSDNGYKVDYQIREENAKARRYTMLLDANGNGSFRVGTKVPYATSLSPSGVGTAYSYIDTGVNINTKVRTHGPMAPGKISLNAEIEISAAQPSEKGSPNPTVANVRVNVSTLISPRKPTLIASIEDPSTMRKFDIEATITPIE